MQVGLIAALRGIYRHHFHHHHHHHHHLGAMLPVRYYSMLISMYY